MEARKITVIETTTQKKTVILSSAETLRDLKKDFTAKGINYRDMSFYEGISRTEIVDNDEVLPHDVMYKGVPTNELVFMLTTKNKKIKSGANRQEMIQFIKSHSLQEVCRKTFNKNNFTNCSNDELEKVVNQYTNKNSDPIEEQLNTIKEITKYIIYSLCSHNFISDDKKDEFLSILYNKSQSGNLESPYSEEDIDDMFDFVE